MCVRMRLVNFTCYPVFNGLIFSHIVAPFTFPLAFLDSGLALQVNETMKWIGEWMKVDPIGQKIDMLLWTGDDPGLLQKDEPEDAYCSPTNHSCPTSDCGCTLCVFILYSTPFFLSFFLSVFLDLPLLLYFLSFSLSFCSVLHLFFILLSLLSFFLPLIFFSVS